ncbi:DUF6318 family protein [Nocardioides sp. AE5]|uniref:DUF6318 family protein n=1 Tax=Nocardioides sp. AE5 TaxID=2962573 RepID=UPI0028823953|nr:DUF6318 family protein [Nocardioides sp. AE5]MDT0200407.1 DUF6318 family protein [Nocardioides sp. AE5]
MDGLMGFMRRVAVVVACVPVLVLAGCGDDEPAEPVELPSLSPSAPVSPSASESVGVEELPASEVEPEEFVRAWVEAYNAATLNGDTTRMRAMSAEGCVTCASLAESYFEIYDAGGSITVNAGEPVEVSELHLEPGTTELEAQVSAGLHFNSGKTVESAGAEPVAFQESDLAWDFYLAVVDGHWRITDIGI